MRKLITSCSTFCSNVNFCKKCFILFLYSMTWLYIERVVLFSCHAWFDVSIQNVLKTLLSYFRRAGCADAMLWQICLVSWESCNLWQMYKALPTFVFPDRICCEYINKFKLCQRRSSLCAEMLQKTNVQRVRMLWSEML